MSSTLLLHRVFVYGTLKTRQPNHGVLKDASNGVTQFVGKAITEKLYPLVVACSYNIPFLLPSEGKGKNIHGEVYSVDDKMLKVLDDFEGHPTLYERQQISVSLGDKPELCWCYILQKNKPELLQLPFMHNYDNNDPKALKYVIRCMIGAMDTITDYGTCYAEFKSYRIYCNRLRTSTVGKVMSQQFLPSYGEDVKDPSEIDLPKPK